MTFGFYNIPQKKKQTVITLPDDGKRKKAVVQRTFFMPICFYGGHKKPPFLVPLEGDDD